MFGRAGRRHSRRSAPESFDPDLKLAAGAPQVRRSTAPPYSAASSLAPRPREQRRGEADKGCDWQCGVRRAAARNVSRHSRSEPPRTPRSMPASHPSAGGAQPQTITRNGRPMRCAADARRRMVSRARREADRSTLPSSLARPAVQPPVSGCVVPASASRSLPGSLSSASSSSRSSETSSRSDRPSNSASSFARAAAPALTRGGGPAGAATPERAERE